MLCNCKCLAGACNAAALRLQLFIFRLEASEPTSSMLHEINDSFHSYGHSSAFGCEMLSSNCTHSFCSFQLCRHSDATNAVRNPQRRTHCEATKCCKETIFFSIRVRQTQYATHSGVRTAEPRNSSAFGCDKRNARPTAAHAPQRNQSLRHSDATKAMRSPQRRAHCRATKFLGMCDEGNAQPAAAHAPHSNEIH